jgi:hypothetical protein
MGDNENRLRRMPLRVKKVGIRPAALRKPTLFVLNRQGGPEGHFGEEKVPNGHEDYNYGQ